MFSWTFEELETCGWAWSADDDKLTLANSQGSKFENLKSSIQSACINSIPDLTKFLPLL